MKLKHYSELLFWQKSHQVVKNIILLMHSLPKTVENQIILKQIFRSTTSVSANIAEGYGRYNGKEYPRFLKNALGSAYENDYWLLLLADVTDQHDKLISESKSLNIEVINMLTKTIQTIESKDL